MSDRRLFVLGAGGHGKVVADAARAARMEVVGFLDSNVTLSEHTVLGLPVEPSDLAAVAQRCVEERAGVVVAIGLNATRKRIFDALRALGVPLVTVVHPSAVIAPGVAVGDGSVVFAGAIVNVSSRIGCNAIVNTGARLDHDNDLGDHAHVSPGVSTGGEVCIGEGAHLGVGVSVRNRTRIGAWSVIGVGAAVVSPIPERVVAYGVPARVVKPVPSS